MLIAQISDIHLRAEGSLAYGVADTAARLNRTVEHLNRMQPQPDVVLATGDLVDDGDPRAYEHLRRLLVPLQPPIFLLPGNHDHKPSLLKAFPEHSYLTWPVKEHGRQYFCYAVETFPLRLVCLDTVTPGDHGGGLGPRQLCWLDLALSALPQAPAVVCMHHAPFASGIGHMDAEPFKGWEELARIIARHPQVERILCGHLHRTVFRRFAGTIAAACPGIGMQLALDLRPDAPSAFVMEPPAAMLHTWSHSWGHPPAMLTHVSLVENESGQYTGPHPFFDVVSPR
jgi:3',5'-cyclic AMP phosphodiesterase CpdA